MTLAVPIDRFAGEIIGVLEAEVNLKYVWDVFLASGQEGLDTPTLSPDWVISSPIRISAWFCSGPAWRSSSKFKLHFKLLLP